MLDLVNAKQVLNTLGLGEITGIIPLQGGNSPVYRLETGEGTPLVLKLYPDSAHLSPAKDAYAASLLNGLDLPTTRYVLVDETKQRLPVRFAVTNHLPGEPLSSFNEHPGLINALCQMGAALRKLHSVPMPGYGFFDASRALVPRSSNSELVSAMVPEVIDEFMAMGGGADLVQKLRSILDWQFDAIVLSSTGPVFAHNDLQPNNVLFVETQDGALQLSGVIDYGSFCAADPLSDLAKCLFCTEHDMPGSSPYFLAGYGPLNHPDPAGALSFYTIMHRLIMWNWLRTNNIIAAPDAPSDIIDALKKTAALN
jgi:aminoglycoside phosphotransferase (APT) family kinase protein